MTRTNRYRASSSTKIEFNQENDMANGKQQHYEDFRQKFAAGTHVYFEKTSVEEEKTARRSVDKERGHIQQRKEQNPSKWQG